MARLETYAALLVKWQKAINLVGPKTLPDLWRRHFLDSAQLAPLIPGGVRTLVDIGSGAGFPGLVLAIMGAAPEVHLIEADRRKAEFLRAVSRETAAPATVHAARIEAVADLKADAITARALAPLAELLSMTEALRHRDTVCLFPKGAGAASELTAAEEKWMMRVEAVPSATAPDATIFRLSAIAPRNGRPTGPDKPTHL